MHCERLSRLGEHPLVQAVYSVIKNHNKNCLSPLFKATLGFGFFLRINPVLDEIPEAPLSLFAGFFSIFRLSVSVTSTGKAADPPGFTTLFGSLKS